MEIQRYAPARYLGLDVGSRRIGVAVSDELGLTAQPVLTLERRGSGLPTGERICARWRGFAGALAWRESWSAIRCISPAKSSPQAAKTQAFAAELGELTGLPIHLWDERLTTHEAHQILYEAGHERQEHGKVVDQVAATLILQSFLDAQQGVSARRRRQR